MKVNDRCLVREGENCLRRATVIKVKKDTYDVMMDGLYEMFNIPKSVWRPLDECICKDPKEIDEVCNGNCRKCPVHDKCIKLSPDSSL